MTPQTGPAESLTDLLAAAAQGSTSAWNRLVNRFTPLLWSVCRGYRLSQADSADVVQTTWLRLLEHLDRIQDPERVAGWLGTTCRRECQALVRRSRRIEPVDSDAYLDRLAGIVDSPDAPALLADRDDELWRAFTALTERCQRLLRVLVAHADDEPVSYREAAELLDMPIGALGPTRRRCLQRLRLLLGDA